MNKLDNTDESAFYFNLHDKKFYLERYGDHQPDLKSADNVDLLFILTHGGAWSTTSTLCMWNKHTRAFTSEMRLGDSAIGGGGLSILATYACNTLKSSDNLLWTRLGPMFSGRLRIALGSHDKLYSGTYTNECGEDFAEDIQSGMTLKSAWKSALSDWWEDQDVAVVATGSSTSHCHWRKDTMKWQNYKNYRVLRDSSIAYWCSTTWDNL